jgi:hypothetical protein
MPYGRSFAVNKFIGDILGLLAAAVVLLSSTAWGAPIYTMNVGTSSFFVIEFDHPNPALSAVANINAALVTTTQLGLVVNLTNDTSVPSTSALGTLTQAALMSIGFDFTPDATGATLSRSPWSFDQVTIGDINFPGGFRVDVCVYSANNCQGGSVNDGLFSGQSDTFGILLTRGASNDPWLLNTAAVKFQTNLDSYKFGGCVREQCSDTPGGKVPEPGTLILLSTVALAASMTSRRRRQKF